MTNPHPDHVQAAGLFAMALSLLAAVWLYLHGWLPWPLQDIVKYAFH